MDFKKERLKEKFFQPFCLVYEIGGNMRIGIDLGGSHIGVGLVDEKGNILAKKEKDITSKENIEEQIESTITQEIQEVLDMASVSIEDIQNIGIAAPRNSF